MPADRGLYSCAFENEVKKAESSMHLRIERKSFELLALLLIKVCALSLSFSNSAVF